MKTLPKARFLILLTCFLLSACQPTQKTIAPELPIVATPTQTPSPTYSTSTPILPTLTPTLKPELQITPQDLYGIHVRLWHPWSGEMALQLVTLVDEFNRTNQWDIFVEARELSSSGQLFDAMLIEWQDDQTRPHLIIASIDHFLTFQDFDTQSQLIVNLNDYIYHPDLGMTIQDTMDFPLVFWEQDEIKSYRLGIPIQRTGFIIYYNQSWAKELGFDAPPSTPQEFEEQACAAARSMLNDLDINKRGTGGWIINTDPMTILSWLFAFGAERMPDEPDGEYHLNTPAVIEALSYLQGLSNKGCAWISRFPEPAQYFSKRQALFYSGSLLDLSYQARVLENAKSTDEWTVLPYPHETGMPVLVVGGNSLAIIRANPQEQMAAWLFSRWLLAPEHLARLVSASASFPVRISTLDYLDKFRQDFPQWSQAFSWLPWAQPSPRQPSWRTARWVISDAAWNVLNPNVLPTPIPFILEQAETTIIELMNQP